MRTSSDKTLLVIRNLTETTWLPAVESRDHFMNADSISSKTSFMEPGLAPRENLAVTHDRLAINACFSCKHLVTQRKVVWINLFQNAWWGFISFSPVLLYFFSFFPPIVLWFMFWTHAFAFISLECLILFFLWGALFCSALLCSWMCRTCVGRLNLY